MLSTVVVEVGTSANKGDSNGLAYSQLSKSGYRHRYDSVNPRKSYISKKENEKMKHDGQKVINDEVNTDKNVPFPKLLPRWYALQLSEEKLCYPHLSKKWVKKRSFYKSQQGQNISPNCNADQTDIPFNHEIPCSHKDDKTLQQTVEKNTNSQIPYQGISKQWYRRRGALSLKNRSRNRQVISGGSLQENLKAIIGTNINLAARTKKTRGE